MADKTPKTCNLITVNPFKYDGKHYAVGEVLMNVDAELALELTGAGRTELATEERLAEAKKAAKAAAKAE
jgi:hypothetical protein